MAETGSVSAKKKKLAATSPTKSVKFNKIKTPLSEKKKFAKTPHSSKTPAGSATSPTAKKKRKLSFTNTDSSENESPQKISPKKLKLKKAKIAAKQPAAEPASDAEQTPPKKPSKGDNSAVKKRKAEDAELSSDKPAKKKRILTDAQKLKEKQEFTVFVGNLPTTITKQGITKAFSQFGKVRSARIRCIPLKPEAKNRKSGAILKQFSGAAAASFIKFWTLEDAQKSLALNGTLLEGNRIRVDMADPSKQRATNKNKAIFLRNLHFQLTDDELWAAFEDCGPIESVRIIKNKSTYLGRGLGYVNFDATDAVELALKKDGIEIKGRAVKVQRCDYVSPHAEKNAGSKKKKQVQEETPKKEKKKKNKEGADKEGIDFTGSKTQPKKKVKKKLSAAGLKKKKIAEILAAKS